MQRWIHRSLWAAGVLALLGVAGAAGAVRHGEAKRARQVSLPPHPDVRLVLATDAAALKRGRYLYASRGCVDCHGANGAGRTFIDDGQGMRVVGPNLTTGEHSATRRYTVEDWERTLRHGVKPDGRPVLVMPSEDYAGYTEADLLALVAYVKQLPPVAGEMGEVTLPLPVRALYGLGVVQDAAEKIDHHRPPPQPVPAAVTPEHGRYVAQMCQGCHGPGLSGGKVPGGAPSWPAAANLTPGAGSVMPHYPDAQAFASMLRTGRRPDGTRVSPVMPFESLRELDEVDTRALYAYLQTVPARPAGER